MANGWHLWLSTALIGIQEKCHRTTCVPSCLKLWNGQLFLKMTTGSLSHFVLMDLSCKNNHLCLILSQVVKWTIFENYQLFFVLSCLQIWRGQSFWKWSIVLWPILALVMKWKIFLKWLPVLCPILSRWNRQTLWIWLWHLLIPLDTTQANFLQQLNYRMIVLCYEFYRLNSWGQKGLPDGFCKRR